MVALIWATLVALVYATLVALIWATLVAPSRAVFFFKSHLLKEEDVGLKNVSAAEPSSSWGRLSGALILLEDTGSPILDLRVQE